tara:strand:- start:13549 stop:15327 length:1779 start_codon:yes stop_codon:yes gene_type:complete
MRSRPLFVQLVRSYILVSLILFFVFTIIAGTTFRNFYHNRIEDDLRARAELVKGQFLYDLSIQYYAKMQETAERLGRESNTRITIMDLKGNVLADTYKSQDTKKQSLVDSPEFEMALKEGLGIASRYYDAMEAKYTYVAIPIQDAAANIGVLRLGVPVTSLSQTLNQIYAQLLLGGLVSCLLVAILCWYISRRMSRPLEDIKALAEKMKSGDFSIKTEIKPSLILEVQTLGTAIMSMAKQLQKRIDTILAQKNELDTVFASMSEGLITIGLDGKIGHINSMAEKILKLDAAKDKNFEEAIKEGPVVQYIKEAMSRDFIDEQEVRIYDGKKVTLRLRGSQKKNSKGETNGVIIVINDITEIVLAEKQRRDFVANVSHELRTPLTSIQGFAETLMNPAVQEPKEVKKFVEIIHKHANRLGALIEDILALSRLEKDTENQQIELTYGKLSNSVENAAELCRSKAEKMGIEIVTSCPDDIQVKRNHHLLEQAILNLIDNALKYSDSKSKIEVFVDETEDFYRINVRDYGAGISQKHLARLFERFYRIDKARTSSEGGTGLGLAIVKHVAMAHGGHVDVKSNIGEGSTFSISIPKPT